MCHVNDESGVETNKQEEEYTKSKLKLAKLISRALFAIHVSVNKKYFEPIQECETTKLAWEILKTHFEVATKVKSSTNDFLASRFENLKMGEHEPLEEFNSQISGLARESLMLMKKCQEKKLAYKFFRCLPSKYTSYKAYMLVSLTAEEISFNEVVGMLIVHEMELKVGYKGKGVALVSHEAYNSDNEDNDPVSVLVRRFEKVIERVKQGQKKRSSSRHSSEAEKCDKKAEV